MSKLLLTLLCSVAFLSSFAQDYIVTLRSDTLRGNVKLLSYDLVDRLQLSVNKKKTIYTALQVRRAFSNGETYAPVKYDNGVRLMKVIVSGYISLYAYRGPQQGNYDTKVIQKIGLDAIEVPNMGFKKNLSDLVGECPVVVDKVKNGDLDRNDVDKIVVEYNQCITNVNAQRIEAAATPEKTPVSDVIEKLKTKVNQSDLSNKGEVNDLLTSINDKMKKKEPIPTYMKEGLKGYLSSKEDMRTELDQLLNLIGN